MNYYIVSLKHTGAKDKHITLWRPKNAGYCWPLELAGIYDEIKSGYHNQDGSIPIPVDSIFQRFIVKDDRGRDCIKNSRSFIKYIKSFKV